MKNTLKTALIGASLLASAATIGEEAAAWANFGGVSHHLDRGNQNEFNPGFGFEKEVGGFNLMAGAYRNSIRQSSKYFAVEKIIVERGAFGLGVLAGFVDGYALNNGGFIPVVVPTLTVEYGRIGARVMYTPGLEEKASAAVSLQFRLRLNII